MLTSILELDTWTPENKNSQRAKLSIEPVLLEVISFHTLQNFVSSVRAADDVEAVV